MEDAELVQALWVQAQALLKVEGLGKASPRQRRAGRMRRQAASGVEGVVVISRRGTRDEDASPDKWPESQPPSPTKTSPARPAQVQHAQLQPSRDPPPVQSHHTSDRFQLSPSARPQQFSRPARSPSPLRPGAHRALGPTFSPHSRQHAQPLQASSPTPGAPRRLHHQSLSPPLSTSTAAAMHHSLQGRDTLLHQGATGRAQSPFLQRLQTLASLQTSPIPSRPRLNLLAPLSPAPPPAVAAVLNASIPASPQPPGTAGASPAQLPGLRPMPSLLSSMGQPPRMAKQQSLTPLQLPSKVLVPPVASPVKTTRVSPARTALRPAPHQHPPVRLLQPTQHLSLLPQHHTAAQPHNLLPRHAAADMPPLPAPPTSPTPQAPTSTSPPAIQIHTGTSPEAHPSTSSGGGLLGILGDRAAGSGLNTASIKTREDTLAPHSTPVWASEAGLGVGASMQQPQSQAYTWAPDPYDPALPPYQMAMALTPDAARASLDTLDREVCDHVARQSRPMVPTPHPVTGHPVLDAYTATWVDRAAAALQAHTSNAPVPSSGDTCVSDAGCQAVVVTGLPGVGKSQLMRQVSQRMTSGDAGAESGAWRYSCYVDLQHVSSVEAACEAILSSLGADLQAPLGPWGWQPALAAWLRGRHLQVLKLEEHRAAHRAAMHTTHEGTHAAVFQGWWGLLLDNTDQLPTDELEGLIQDLVVACPSMQVVWSQSSVGADSGLGAHGHAHDSGAAATRGVGAGVVRVHMEPLPQVLAWEVLSAGASTDHAIAQRLCKACAGLPGPLLLAVRLLQHCSPTDPQCRDLVRELSQLARHILSPPHPAHTRQRRTVDTLAEVWRAEEAAVEGPRQERTPQIHTTAAGNTQGAAEDEVAHVSSVAAAREMCDLLTRSVLQCLPVEVLCGVEALVAYSEGWCDIQAAMVLLSLPTSSEAQLAGDGESLIRRLTSLGVLTYHPGASQPVPTCLARAARLPQGPVPTEHEFTVSQRTTGSSMGGVAAGARPAGERVTQLQPMVCVPVSVRRSLRQEHPAESVQCQALRAEARQRGLCASLAGVPWLLRTALASTQPPPSSLAADDHEELAARQDAQAARLQNHRLAVAGLLQDDQLGAAAALLRAVQAYNTHDWQRGLRDVCGPIKTLEHIMLSHMQRNPATLWTLPSDSITSLANALWTGRTLLPQVMRHDCLVSWTKAAMTWAERSMDDLQRASVMHARMSLLCSFFAACDTNMSQQGTAVLHVLQNSSEDIVTSTTEDGVGNDADPMRPVHEALGWQLETAEDFAQQQATTVATNTYRDRLCSMQCATQTLIRASGHGHADVLSALLMQAELLLMSAAPLGQPVECGEDVNSIARLATVWATSAEGMQRAWKLAMDVLEAAELQSAMRQHDAAHVVALLQITARAHSILGAITMRQGCWEAAGLHWQAAIQAREATLSSSLQDESPHPELVHSREQLILCLSSCGAWPLAVDHAQQLYHAHTRCYWGYQHLASLKVTLDLAGALLHQTCMASCSHTQSLTGGRGGTAQISPEAMMDAAYLVDHAQMQLAKEEQRVHLSSHQARRSAKVCWWLGQLLQHRATLLRLQSVLLSAAGQGPLATTALANAVWCQRQALRLSPGARSHTLSLDRLAYLYQTLATTLDILGCRSQARGAMIWALKLRLVSHGRSHPSVQGIIQFMADQQQAAGNTTAATKLLQWALQLSEQHEQHLFQLQWLDQRQQQAEHALLDENGDDNDDALHQPGAARSTRSPSTSSAGSSTDATSTRATSSQSGAAAVPREELFPQPAAPDTFMPLPALTCGTFAHRARLLSQLAGVCHQAQEYTGAVQHAQSAVLVYQSVLRSLDGASCGSSQCGGGQHAGQGAGMPDDRLVVLQRLAVLDTTCPPAEVCSSTGLGTAVDKALMLTECAGCGVQLGEAAEARGAVPQAFDVYTAVASHTSNAADIRLMAALGQARCVWLQTGSTLPDDLGRTVSCLVHAVMQQAQLLGSQPAGAGEQPHGGTVLSAALVRQQRQTAGDAWCKLGRLAEAMGRFWRSADLPVASMNTAVVALQCKQQALAALCPNTPQGSGARTRRAVLTTITQHGAQTMHAAERSAPGADDLVAALLWPHDVGDWAAVQLVQPTQVPLPARDAVCGLCCDLATAHAAVAHAQALLGRQEAAEQHMRCAVAWHELVAQKDSVMSLATARLQTQLALLLKMSVLATTPRRHALQRCCEHVALQRSGQHLQEAADLLDESVACITQTLGHDHEEGLALCIELGELLILDVVRGEQGVVAPGGTGSTEERVVRARHLLTAAGTALLRTHGPADLRVLQSLTALSALALHWDHTLATSEALTECLIARLTDSSTTLGLPTPPSLSTAAAPSTLLMPATAPSLTMSARLQLAVQPIVAPATHTGCTTEQLRAGAHHGQGPLSPAQSVNPVLVSDLSLQPSTEAEAWAEWELVTAAAATTGRSHRRCESQPNNSASAAWSLPSSAREVLSPRGTAGRAPPIRRLSLQRTWLEPRAAGPGPGPEPASVDPQQTPQTPGRRASPVAAHRASKRSPPSILNLAHDVLLRRPVDCAGPMQEDKGRVSASGPLQTQTHPSNAPQICSTCHRRSDSTVMQTVVSQQQVEEGAAGRRTAAALAFSLGQCLPPDTSTLSQLQQSQSKLGMLHGLAVLGTLLPPVSVLDSAMAATTGCVQSSTSQQKQGRMSLADGDSSLDQQQVAGSSRTVSRAELEALCWTARAHLQLGQIRERQGRKRGASEAYCDSLALLQCMVQTIQPAIPAAWLDPACLDSQTGYLVGQALAGCARCHLGLHRTIPGQQMKQMGESQLTRLRAFDIPCRCDEDSTLLWDTQEAPAQPEGIPLQAVMATWPTSAPGHQAALRSAECIAMLRDALALLTRQHEGRHQWQTMQITSLQCDLALALAAQGGFDALREAEALARRAITTTRDLTSDQVRCVGAVQEADAQLVLSAVLTADYQLHVDSLSAAAASSQTPQQPSQPGIHSSDRGPMSRAQVLAFLSGVHTNKAPGQPTSTAEHGDSGVEGQGFKAPQPSGDASAVRQVQAMDGTSTLQSLGVPVESSGMAGPAVLSTPAEEGTVVMMGSSRVGAVRPAVAQMAAASAVSKATKALEAAERAHALRQAAVPPSCAHKSWLLAEALANWAHVRSCCLAGDEAWADTALQYRTALDLLCELHEDGPLAEPVLLLLLDAATAAVTAGRAPTAAQWVTQHVACVELLYRQTGTAGAGARGCIGGLCMAEAQQAVALSQLMNLHAQVLSLSRGQLEANDPLQDVAVEVLPAKQGWLSKMLHKLKGDSQGHSARLEPLSSKVFSSDGNKAYKVKSVPYQHQQHQQRGHCSRQPGSHVDGVWLDVVGALPGLNR